MFAEFIENLLFSRARRQVLLLTAAKRLFLRLAANNVARSDLLMHILFKST